MQTKKEYIHEKIVIVAKEIFLREGFIKTSMRDIAKGSGIGVSNMYNYFKSKDELFKYIVMPLIIEMKKIINEHHNKTYQDKFQKFANEDSNEMMSEHIQTYIRLINNHQDEFKLIMYKAHGSTLENFIDNYTDECTHQVIDFMNNFKQKHPQTGTVNSLFTYHIHTVWMFSFISEIIKHNLSSLEVEKAVKDYIHFEFIGWKNIMNQ